MQWEARAGTLCPRLHQEEEAREGKVCSDAEKTISEGSSCLAQWPSRSMEQWEWCVRTMAAEMETRARQCAAETAVENKEGMSTLERPVSPACRTDGPRHHCLGNSHRSVQYSCLWGLASLPPSQLWSCCRTLAPPASACPLGWAQPGRVIRLCRGPCSARSSAGQGRVAVGPLFIVGLPATAALRGVTLASPARGQSLPEPAGQSGPCVRN